MVLTTIHYFQCTTCLRSLKVARPLQKGIGFSQPTQCLEHLGLVVDTRLGEFRVGQTKLEKMESRIKTLLGSAARQLRRVEKRQLAAVIGQERLPCKLAL